MYCTNCGFNNKDENRYCKSCGSQLPILDADGNIISSENTNYTSNPQNNTTVYYQQNMPQQTKASYFDGNVFQLLGLNILCTIISVITFGFGVPWASVLKTRWVTKHTVINGKRLYFNGTASQLFGKIIGWILIQMGVLVVGLIAATVSGSYVGGYYSYSTATANMAFVAVVNVIILILTLPAYQVYIKKWEVKHTTFIDDTGIAYEHSSNGNMYYINTNQSFNNQSFNNIPHINK